ncbi:MAG: hypothetical protein MI924_37135 [Chloroflexales bacterium]|nr:hypothetical protein [Chloroflexales bacterium]
MNVPCIDGLVLPLATVRAYNRWGNAHITSLPDDFDREVRQNAFSSK